MAFLVSGAGTSIGAVTGAMLFARGRVVGLVVALLFGGAVPSMLMSRRRGGRYAGQALDC
jgi:hypothetical protein